MALLVPLISMKLRVLREKIHTLMYGLKYLLFFGPLLQQVLASVKASEFVTHDFKYNNHVLVLNRCDWKYMHVQAFVYSLYKQWLRLSMIK